MFSPSTTAAWYLTVTGDAMCDSCFFINSPSCPSVLMNVVLQAIPKLKPEFPTRPGCGQRSSSFDCRPFNECEEVCIDHVGIRGDHAVCEARVHFERGILEELGLHH